MSPGGKGEQGIYLSSPRPRKHASYSAARRGLIKPTRSPHRPMLFLPWSRQLLAGAFVPSILHWSLHFHFRQLPSMTAFHKTSNPPPRHPPHSCAVTARARPRVVSAGRLVHNPPTAPRWVPVRGRVLRSVLRAVFSCFKPRRQRRPSAAGFPSPPASPNPS